MKWKKVKKKNYGFAIWSNFSSAFNMQWDLQNYYLLLSFFNLFVETFFFFFDQDKLKNVDQERLNSVAKNKLKNDDVDIEENTKSKRPVPKKVSYQFQIIFHYYSYTVLNQIILLNY